MKTPRKRHLVLANGATGPPDVRQALRLHYIKGQPGQIIHIALPQFVQNVFYLPSRVLDLLEIATYIFAADRCLSRGPKVAVEYHSWSRYFDFYIRVRDHKFWAREDVVRLLADALTFMTGDAEYTFHFEPGHTTPPTNLFDKPAFSIDPGESKVVTTLFSGGLDSLSGVLELLSNGDAKIILVSHQSQPGTIHTQRALVEALKAKYPNRIHHYSFNCTLREKRGPEETQRTRSFLYTSIAYAIASAYKQDNFFVFENGVTSINLYRREDLANARASRTTHPQTIAKIKALFSLLGDTEFKICLPYLFKTKAEVLGDLKTRSPELISSTVSCTRTFKVEGEATHCGHCFQCIDRRIAAYSAEAEEFDHQGLYVSDLINDPINDAEAKTTALDYIRQAKSLLYDSIDKFASEHLDELAQIVGYLPEDLSESETVNKLWEIFRRHGLQVKKALLRMRSLHDDVFGPIHKDSLLGIVSEREYLKPELIRLAETLSAIIGPAIGEMFAENKPKDEPDLNKKLGALLRTHNDRIRSEHPTASFACAQVVPDHLDADLLIEAKYIRGKTSPSKATEGIAADLTKYPTDKFILFVIYDPQHKIASDKIYCSDIESKGRNKVLIIR